MRYVAERPLALCLDVAVVRGLLGGWLDRPHEAGCWRWLGAEFAGVVLVHRTYRDLLDQL